MRGVWRRSIAAVSALVAIVSLSVSMATAQNTNSAGNGFRVSPVRSEYTIDKGRSETLVVTVENPTDAAIKSRVVINDFVASDQENGEPRLILDDNAPAPKNSFKKLVAPIADIQLGPRQKKDVPVSINVGGNANAGGYYGAVRFIPADTGGNGNVGLTASVGTIVLVTVPGDLTEKLDLVELGATQNGELKGFMTGGDLSIVARLKNTGDIHVKPFGKVQIKNMFGKVVKEYELNAVEPRANILPESVRKFEDAVAKPGRGWFGRYTVQANIGYSQGSGDLITASSSFWYLPVWFLVLLVVLAAIVAGVFWLVRRYRGGASSKRR